MERGWVGVGEGPMLLSSWCKGTTVYSRFGAFLWITKIIFFCSWSILWFSEIFSHVCVCCSVSVNWFFCSFNFIIYIYLMKLFVFTAFIALYFCQSSSSCLCWTKHDNGSFFNYAHFDSLKSTKLWPTVLILYFFLGFWK